MALTGDSTSDLQYNECVIAVGETISVMQDFREISGLLSTQWFNLISYFPMRFLNNFTATISYCQFDTLLANFTPLFDSFAVPKQIDFGGLLKTVTQPIIALFVDTPELFDELKVAVLEGDYQVIGYIQGQIFKRIFGLELNAASLVDSFTFDLANI